MDQLFCFAGEPEPHNRLRLNGFCERLDAWVLSLRLGGHFEPRGDVCRMLAGFVRKALNQFCARLFCSTLQTQCGNDWVVGGKDQPKGLRLVGGQTRQTRAVVEPKLYAALVALMHDDRL